ncbi:flagellar hook-basal body complex protein FliE [Neobacillus novalis]|uniref:Flagellar hook-basal body complex protein FliE n=1 Tax=Neobacillus novalis TaxID=220687 RepID=A0AA95MRL2_9BACI|nr:flagellar hook-basal body complex protein FliE [Neobacillus novalis]WHY89014.1 flagellar hook-basal body complex protein FliE [Neobacillus novalis]
MKITGIDPTSSLLSLNKPQKTEGTSSFESMLNQYIQQTDNAVKDFETKSISLAKGEDINLHDVTIAAQKASIAVQLTTQIRDKAVEAYQEIMRMQV